MREKGCRSRLEAPPAVRSSLIPRLVNSRGLRVIDSEDQVEHLDRQPPLVSPCSPRLRGGISRSRFHTLEVSAEALGPW